MFRLKPTRMTVSDLRPTLSYRVGVDLPSRHALHWVEIALATDPDLFAPDAAARRTADSFVTFRDRFVLRGDDAILHIPPAALLAIAEGARLYAGAALFASNEGGAPLALIQPDAQSVYVAIDGFTGAGVRQRFGFAGRPDIAGDAPLDASSAALTWAGDRPAPGTSPAAALADHASTPQQSDRSPRGMGIPREGHVPMNQSHGFMHKNAPYQQPMPPQAAAPADLSDTTQQSGQSPHGTGIPGGGQVPMNQSHGFMHKNAPYQQPMPPQGAAGHGDGNGQAVDYDDGFDTPAPAIVPNGQHGQTMQPVPNGQNGQNGQYGQNGQGAMQAQPAQNRAQPQPMPAAPTNGPQAQPMPPAPSGVQAPASQQAWSRPFEYVLPAFDSYWPMDVIRTLSDAWSRYQSFTTGVNDTRQFPFSSIVCIRGLKRQKSDGSIWTGTGTAFYIGPNLLLTNAHNFAGSGRFDPVHSATLYAGLNSHQGPGNAPIAGDAVASETIDPSTAVTIHPLYYSSDRSVSRGHDLAVVRVQNSAPHGQHFRIANFSPAADSKIAVCGYGVSSHAQNDPDLDWQDLLPEALYDYKQRMDADVIREVVNGGEGIHYNLQTLGGNSGSPVFLAPQVLEGEDPTALMQVVAVHSSGASNTRNHGVLLTPDKRDWALSGGATAVQQSYAPHPGHYGQQPLGHYGYQQQGPYGQPMAAPAWVPIVTGLIGAAANAGIAGLQSGSGDLTWFLQKMDGWLPAGGHPTPAITVDRSTLKTVRNVEIRSPVYQGTFQGDMYAHFYLDFMYDDAGVGGISIEPAPHASHDNLTGGMRIDMQIQPLLDTFPSRAKTGVQVACVEVKMMYTYEWTAVDNDQVTVIYRLYGDGTYESNVRGGWSSLDSAGTTYTGHRR